MKAALWHRNKEHPGLSHPFSLIDPKTRQKVPLYRLYKCLGLCPDVGCDKMMGQNQNYDLLKFNMRSHYGRAHGDLGEGWDFAVLLPRNEEEDTRIRRTEARTSSRTPIKPDTSLNKGVELDLSTSVEMTRKVEERGKEVVVAAVEEDCNLGFSKKGYSGPYCCLRLGCSYECPPLSHNTQKTMVVHWSSQHGDIKDMLFLDRSTTTVLNAKVICNTLAACSAPGCPRVLYASKKTDFPQSVATHWKTAHAELLSARPTLSTQCRMVVTSMLPTVTERQARRLVLQLPKGTSMDKSAPEKPVKCPSKTPEVAAKAGKVSENLAKSSTAAKSPAPVIRKESGSGRKSVNSEEESEMLKFNGPFNCAACDYSVQKSIATSRTVVGHWTREHGAPSTLCFVDQETGDRLSASSFFAMLGKCTFCEFYTGNNRRESDLRTQMKSHWKSEHPEVKNGESSYTLVNTAANSSTNSLQSCIGPFLCKVDQCQQQWKSSKGWQKKVLAHFHSAHDHLINRLEVEDKPSGKRLKVEHIFEFLGQCNKPDCLSINGVAEATTCESVYQLHRTFRQHYRSQHPGAQVDFSFLVEEHLPKFEVEEKDEPVEEEEDGCVQGLGMLQCTIKGCGEKGIKQYGTHYRQSHQGLAMDKVGAVMLKGTNLTCSDLFTFALRCDQPKCTYVTTTGGASRFTLRKAIRRHWKTAHPQQYAQQKMPKYVSALPAKGRWKDNLSQEAEVSSLSPIKRASKDHLSSSSKFQCLVCSKVLTKREEAGPHYRLAKHGEGAGVKDLATGATVPLTDIYPVVNYCEVAKCNALFWGNVDQVGKELAAHWEELHADVPSLEVETGCQGFQCMAGADNGEVVCSTIIPPGDNGNALRHWQYKHHSLPLRDLMFMEQTSCVILQISDVFSTVLICGRKDCGTVTYTNFLNRGGKVMAGHFVKEHGKPREGEEVYTKMSCPSFQTSNIQITKEHFVDYEDGEEEEEDNTKEAEQEDEELGSEAMEVLGYKCGVVECGKVVLVSRFATAMVALNRLKKHFSQIHRNLNSGQFIYETQYRTEPATTTTCLATTSPAAMLYQCPATMRKGKPCQERMMDANALRIHWGSEHRVDGQQFSPLTLSLDSVAHYLCCVPGCPHKTLSIGPLRNHWESAHPAYGGKFEVILSEPVKAHPSVPLATSPTNVVKDEPPMVPVGRKPKQAQATAQACGHIGCDFASESRRDLARHRRDTGHSKLTGADGIEYVCQEASCSHRLHFFTKR